MRYLVRVELHNAAYNDYETLHSAMAAAGFQRTVRGDNGTLYHLPTAEYVTETWQSGEQVRAAADSAAARTGKPHAVLVVRYDVAWWQNLAQVKAA